MKSKILFIIGLVLMFVLVPKAFAAESNIIAPEPNEAVSGFYTLKANFYEEGNPTVYPYWAVRKGITCGPTEPDVFSWKLNGIPSDWDNINFNFEIDTRELDEGVYCFAWNPRGDYNARRVVVFTIDKDIDDDGVLNEDDMCPNTTVDGPWKSNLGTNRWELRKIEDVYTWYQNKPAKQNRPAQTFDLSYTCGCNGHQILDIYKEMGNKMEGHWKFGLSNSALEDFNLMCHNNN